MRIKRRSAVVIGLAAAGVLALAGIALASGSSTVSFAFNCGSATVPPFNNKCPKSTATAGTINVHTHTNYSSGSSTKTDRARLYFDSDFKVDPGAVPKCNPNNLTGKTLGGAKTACGSSLIGKGTATATANPATPQDVHACVLAFNGQNDNAGNPTVLLFTRAQVPGNVNCSDNNTGNTTIVLAGSLKPANLAGFGKLLDVNHITGVTPLPLNDFNVNVGKGSVANAGGYIKAVCSASPWKMKTIFNYVSPAASQTVNSTRACTN